MGTNIASSDGVPYWDETAYYRFTLRQIEEDLEKPAEEIDVKCASSYWTARWRTRRSIVACAFPGDLLGLRRGQLAEQGKGSLWPAGFFL